MQSVRLLHGNGIMNNNSFARKRTQGNFRSRPGHRVFGPNNNRARKNGSSIDINAFIEKTTKNNANELVEETVIMHTFDDFKLCSEIKKNLLHKGYTTPTPIQDQAINYILDGKDLIGMANTGTGKTAAFLLPMIEKVNKNKKEKVLIIAPTRELALQIESELQQFSYGMKIFYISCVGGMSIGRQMKALKTNPNFIIGTPGRIKDLADRKFIHFETFNNVILDEVDRMLDMGFVDEIRYFLSKLPKQRQSLYFSATMPLKIKTLIETFSVDPVLVKVKSMETPASVEQEVIRAGKEAKFGKLKDILSEPEMNKVLIFAETKRGVEKLTLDLMRDGFKADSIHGDKRQTQRQKALNNFKDNRVNILVATDVAARGLDIKEVTHVINYTVPQTYEDYIHRIGRTGRGNAVGKALTFVE